MFYEYAKNICSLENSIKKELHSIAIGHSGILRLGLTHAAVDSYIESLLLMFHAEYPGIRFEITLNTSSKNIDMLLDNKLDIAFIRLSENLPTNLKHLFVVEEVLVAYFSRDTTWFNSVGDSIDIAELKDIPLSFTIGLKNKLNNLCKQSGFTPRCLCGAATRNQALFWTRHNLSVTLLFCNMEQIPQEKNLLSCKVTSLRGTHNSTALFCDLSWARIINNCKPFRGLCTKQQCSGVEFKNSIFNSFMQLLSER